MESSYSSDYSSESSSEYSSEYSSSSSESEYSGSGSDDLESGRKIQIVINHYPFSIFNFNVLLLGDDS